MGKNGNSIIMVSLALVIVVVALLFLYWNYGLGVIKSKAEGGIFYYSIVSDSIRVGDIEVKSDIDSDDTNIILRDYESRSKLRGAFTFLIITIGIWILVKTTLQIPKFVKTTSEIKKTLENKRKRKRKTH